MGLIKQLEGNKDNKQIYTEIVCAGCTYLDLAITKNDPRSEAAKVALVELMKKLSKVAEEKNHFIQEVEATYAECLSEAKKGVDAVATAKLSGIIENFLAQSKGALDIFAKQFLKEILGFNGNWNGAKLSTHVSLMNDVDADVQLALSEMLRQANDSWVRLMVNDRDSHHERNFHLSDAVIIDGKLKITLTRADGSTTTEILDYVNEIYVNLIELSKDVVRLSIALYQPALKHIHLNQSYFIPEETQND